MCGKMTDKKKGIVITAMVCLTCIELVAMYLGYNGAVRSVIIALIAGLGGWIIPTPKILKGGE